ncbi:putative repeat protein (TIGR01451 family) [Paenibacillus phyllosphaerae]|uniref:Putative repeat protein (TIGR01451 family) n=1 Tax=Paenibacillus phyllosphaerae TaxID=274593 RepID=A0A7W5FR81_9BACL|nr:cadherin-like beta sandwich domain-containing protein [Paenibacillus phyllosphaerae]MBB3114012.1 putative repeat protein (TIGR01451 family) [Paenibacillus phyllosphaerae]
MNRRAKARWKQRTGLLLAAVLALTDVGAASAAGIQGGDMASQSADPFMKAVYEALSETDPIPPDEGNGSSGEETPAEGEAPEDGEASDGGSSGNGEEAEQPDTQAPDDGAEEPVTEEATGPFPAVAVPSEPLSWNLLSKLDRTPVGALFYTDEQEIKLSDDGRYVALRRLIYDEDPMKMKRALAVYDRLTGQTEDIMVPGAVFTDEILHFDMSGDAKYVTFSFMSGTMDQTVNVYVYDREAKKLNVITPTASDGNYGNKETNRVSISGNGRYIAFDSEAQGLVPEDTDFRRDVFVYDRAEKSIVRISAPEGLGEYDYADSESPAISGDGRYIAFQSRTPFTTEDMDSMRDIYVYDSKAQDNAYQLISKGTDNTLADGDSRLPSISADGNVVAFESESANLVPDDTNEVQDIFVSDRAANTLTRVSVRAGGIPFTRDSLYPSLSDDGRYVGFHLDYEWGDDTDEDPDNDDENDLPEEAYVADVAAQTAYPVTVEGGPYELVQPSTMPVVSQGGQLVVYQSNYSFTIEGYPDIYEVPGVFIAAKGEAPAWPEGSVLTGTNPTEDSVTLTWGNAGGSLPVLGYHVYRDNQIIAYVPADASGSNTFTATGLVPAAANVFQVEAVNADYHESFGGPTHKFGTGGGGDPTGELRVQWDTDNIRYGMIYPNSDITVLAQGEAQKQATAEVTYKVWTGETTQETKTAQLTLTEGKAGSYSAKWPMADGVTEVTSIKVKLADPANPGGGTEQTAFGLPVKVSGTIAIDFTNPSGSNLTGSVLSVGSSRYGEQLSVLANSNTYTLQGLYPGDTHTLMLRSPDLRHTWGTIGQVLVEPGRTKKVNMTIEPPASVRFQFVDPTGQPVNGVKVELFGAQQVFIDSEQSGWDGWTEWEENLKAGDKLTAKFNIGDLMMEPVPNQEIVLVPGGNEQVIRLKAPGEGILEGIVRDSAGKVVRNAVVTSTQTYNGQQVVRSMTTNLEGKYKLSVLAGEAKVEVYENSYQYSSEGVLTAQVKEGESTALNVTVRQPNQGVVNLEVRMKYIEDTEFGEPIDMSQMGFLTQISMDDRGLYSGYFSNAYQITGRPGQKVNVCVSATVPSYMNVCTDVTLDANSNGTAKLYLEEKGARIEGKLTKTDHKRVSGSLYKVSEDGYRTYSTYAREEDFNASGQFSIHVPEPGSYVMELSRQLNSSPVTYEYAAVRFTVADHQILQVGDVAFSATNYFSRYNGNVYDALNSRIAPGGTVTFRAAFKNNATADATEAKLLAELPEGTTPVKDGSGKIVVSGLTPAGEVTQDGRTLIIPIGTIEAKKSGTVSFQVKVDPAFNKTSAKSTALIQAKVGSQQVEETIGDVLLDVPVVTLMAPGEIANAAFDISGVAPAGHAVKVYEGGELIGAVTAGDSGYWKLRVQLPDVTDEPNTFALRADVESGGVKLSSETAYVSYDPVKPKLLEIAMAQAPKGKWVTLNVREGMPSMPYTVVPGNPFQFELLFDKPDEVRNVRVYLDGQTGEPVKAVRDGGVYRVLVPTDKGALGDIYVDFDTLPQPFKVNENLPTLDEVRETVPLKMRDFTIEVVSPFELKDGLYSGVVKLTFPQLEDMTMTVTLTLEPDADYTPTQAEVDLAEKLQLPIYNGSTTLTETDDGFYTETKGYVPVEHIFPNGVPSGLEGFQAVSRSSASAVGGAVVAVGMKAYVANGPYGKEVGTVASIKGNYDGMMGFAGKVNNIMYRVQASGLDCIAELPRTVNQAGHALKSLVVGEVSKFALGAWTGAMGLTGPGALAAAGATAVAKSKINDYVDQQISKVGTGFNVCNNNEEELDEDSDIYKLKRKRIAKLKWIYDPSGYIYEAVPTNRISGVQATVLYQDPVTKEWTVWDAGPYEQVNPHNTDDQGKYGWDVPAGKWKVVWEKDGYETKQSAELDVPPPHTEVNAGLVSYEAPKVKTVSGVVTATGSYVDIELTKYVRITELPAQAVTVTGEGGTAIQGTLAFAEPADNPADPSGADLSRIVRFTPTTAITAGADYNVNVKASFFQSYAGVWMTEGYSGAFDVTERDERGPEASSAQVEADGMILRVTFDENVADTVDASKFKLNGSEDRISSAVKSAKEGEGKVVLITLTDPITAGSSGELTVLAGAVTDGLGNPSTDKTLTATSGPAASNDAALASLTVAEGSITPVFDPQTTTYKIMVPSSIASLRITAATADAQARLFVDGAEAVSGNAYVVPIPSALEIPIRVTAADGKTVRDYIIQVTREQAPASTDAALSGLAVTPGTLDPAFDPAKTAYAIKVSAEATTVAVTATARDPKAKSLTIEGAAATSGTAKTVTIPVDGKIDIQVTAEDGTTKRAYTIQVTREQAPASTDAALSGLAVTPGTLDPAFDPAKTSYAIKVSAEATTVAVTATARDPKAKSLTIEGAAATSGTAKTVTIPADGKIDIEVTAEDGTTKRAYTIQVTREQAPASTDAALSGLAVTPGTLDPAFDPAKTSYAIEVEKSVTTVQLTATARNAKSKSLTIAGSDAVSGTAKTVTIPTNNKIDIVVTAEDGKTKRTYTIKVKQKNSGGNGGGGGGVYIPTQPVPVENVTGAAKTETTTNTDGTKLLRVTLVSDSIAKSLHNGPNGLKELVIPSSDPTAAQHVLVIPEQAYEVLRNQHADVVLTIGGLQVTVPAALFQSSLLQPGQSLQLTLTQQGDESASEAAAGQSGHALSLAGPLVSVKAEAVQAGVAAALELTASLALKLEFTLDTSSLEAIYRYDAERSEWTYVPGQQLPAGGGTATIAIRSSDIYAVLRYTRPFVDLSSHWAVADIDWMAQRMLVNGTSSQAFEPNKTITRAEFAAMLVRALDVRVEGTSPAEEFSDISKNAWYYDAVQASVAAGLMKGIDGDTFEPNAPITREQAAVIIWRAYAKHAGLDEHAIQIGELRAFQDYGDISGWAAEGIAGSLANGLMQGSDAGLFNPSGLATRAEAAVIMKRLVQSTV